MVDERGLRERSFAQWPEDAVAGGMDDLNQRLYMQYLGVMSLLGRVMADNPRIPYSTRQSVESAFVDANVLLRRRGSTLYYERSTGGGYSAFESEPGETVRP